MQSLTVLSVVLLHLSYPHSSYCNVAKAPICPAIKTAARNHLLAGQNPFVEVKSPVNNIDQSEAAHNVIKDYMGPRNSKFFNVVVNPVLSRNTFRVFKNSSMECVYIEGDSGVSVCKGFYYYIENACNCHISWDGVQMNFFENEANLDASSLPNLDVMKTSFSYWVYYQNVCTWSYSFAWWEWEDWRTHLNWMAVNGINLALAPFQEDVWSELYEEVGMTREEIDEHLSGVGFQAWQRMGNIRGWGGPLSKSSIERHSELQKQIIEYANNLGITLALPAFAGHVPVAFQRIFPYENFTEVCSWNKFDKQYCCPLFVDPTSDLFEQIGTRFLTKVIDTYGTNHIYFADPFNEISPSLATEEYVGAVSEKIYRAMSEVDPAAVWLLQGWMFVNRNSFWNGSLIKAFLTAVPIGQMLILDLQAEQQPQYERTFSFFGQPYIWCMLHNFGGTSGMHGSTKIVNENIAFAKNFPNSTMVGVGITPEGIFQNYVMYDFALKMAWTGKPVDLEMWFDHYALRRYGSDDSFAITAWQSLRQSVYSYKGSDKIYGKYPVCSRPSLKIKTLNWYDRALVVKAWENMLRSELRHQLFLHDLVDVTRQALQNRGDQFYEAIVQAYKHRESKSVKFMGRNFVNLLQDMDLLLNTNTNFMLGPWLKAAKSSTNSTDERSILEKNARAQITTWGPNGEIVNYATKQWAGLFEDLFIPRWKFFFHQLFNSIVNNETFHERSVKKKLLLKYEQPFLKDQKSYPLRPTGDSVGVSKALFEKWGQNC